MIYLDYLLLSLKADRHVPIGPSYFSWLLSSEYNRQFARDLVSNVPHDTAVQQPSHGYLYPRLQYKVIRGAPHIAAIAEGCPLLWDIYKRLDEINESQTEWKIAEKRIIEKKAPFGICGRLVKYRILTPWLALSESSLKSFLVGENGQREKILAGALEGHIRSISRSLGYEIEADLRLKVTPKPDYIFQRDIHYAGFFGTFIANFELPNLLGLGKSVSRGYGTVKRIGPLP